MKSFTVDAAYVRSAKGRILLTWRKPEAPRGCVLLVPPFAEEMNKSRRMFTELGVALAQRGLATVIPDLFGTGDSEGEFADADWQTWLDDLASAAQWSQQYLAPVIAYVAVRLGAELAADASQQSLLPPVRQAVLWQPVFDRARHFTQFLRLRTAASLSQREQGESADDLRRQLELGGSVEIAGYEISGNLAKDLWQGEARRWMPETWSSVQWFEIQRDANVPVPLPSRRIIHASEARGCLVSTWVTTGEHFWATTEIVVNPAVIARSSEVLGA